MKRLLLGLLILLWVPALAQGLPRPELEVRLSPGNLPTQRIEPGTESVEILRIWLSSRDHPVGYSLVKKITFQHEGDDRDHFLRYSLVQGNKILGKISLPDSDSFEFKNLNISVADGKTIELRFLADVATGDIEGEHQFTISHPDNIVTKKDDIRDPDTWVFGDFPILPNRILIGKYTKSPTPECNLREEPVCGEDGRTYFNLCIPFYKKVKIAYEGHCRTVDFKEEPIICAEVYEPVCGEDGRTYSNECFLNAKGTFLKHEGECFPQNAPRPTSFSRAADLFRIKKNEILQLRPRIGESTAVALNAIDHIFRTYDFTFKSRKGLIDAVGDFLDFAKNPSDRQVLQSEIESLRLATAETRTQSARQKYEKGLIPFIDVNTDEWFFGPVRFLKSKGWISGYLDAEDQTTGVFGPGKPLTRAEITKLAFAIAGIIPNPDVIPQNPKAKDHWASALVAEAERRNLTLWVDDSNPDKKARRGEVIQLLLEVFGITPPHQYSRQYFSDLKKDSEYFSPVQYARDRGLISGYPDGTFRAKNQVLRAEAAKIIQNAFETLAR